MSAKSELTKLEAMYYHMREDRHIRFLESNDLYRQIRQVGHINGIMNDGRRTPSKSDE